MKQIFTIGYSGFNIEEFILALKEHKINTVIDVRSNPNSKFYPAYNKATIEGTLKLHNIIYRNFQNEFGARQLDSSYYSEEGYLDFVKFAKSEQFLKGVSKIEKGVNAGYTVALLCAEKNPEVCHRAILVAREFSKLGYQVFHLLPCKQIITQSEIEENLLNNYFINNQQISFFSHEELIDQAYAKRNEEIGYKMEDER